MVRQRQKKKVMVVLGTRPEIIRLTPVVFEIKKRNNLVLQFIYTGQHYSMSLGQAIFDELGTPPPQDNLGIGPGTEVEQTAKIVLGMEALFMKYRPDVVVVWGDTNSSFGAAISAMKAKIPLAHLEAGCRSYDLRMSEEVNRRLIDHGSILLFPFTENSQQILQNERVMGSIYKVGSPLCDMFLTLKKKIRKPGILEELSLKDGEYILVTSHRAENVDNAETLGKIVDLLAELGTRLTVLFNVHPRTFKNLENFNLMSKLKKAKVKFIEPSRYLRSVDIVNLEVSSRMIITDSGGLQLEAFFAQKPCVVIRKSTEWVESVELGVSFLADPSKTGLVEKVLEILGRSDRIAKKFKTLVNPYGNGRGSKEIVDHLVDFLG